MDGGPRVFDPLLTPIFLKYFYGSPKQKVIVSNFWRLKNDYFMIFYDFYDFILWYFTEVFIFFFIL